ncbi:MAG: hypothetical protein JSW14_01715 [Candidatus Bathyarchaeum sp.]|nr:MAG: hypothetical protein JSW14_01715 [Candidatus Bathyarchaeum sp.]
MEKNIKKNSQAIPREVAFQLCEEIRKEKGVRLFSQCWGCVKFSKNDPDKMCFSGPDYRGCKRVNERYDQKRST